MKLFIAVNFDNYTKKRFENIQNNLKAANVSGKFTPSEILHLTVVFIGEVSGGINKITDIMNFCFTDRITIDFSGTGMFNSSIFFAKAENNPALYLLHNNLCKCLNLNEIPVEIRPFKPHVTLARTVKANGFEALNYTPFSYEAAGLSLMKSERINGRIFYSEIYKKELC